MTSGLYIIGSILSGSILTGGVAMAWRLGRMAQALQDLKEAFDRHTANGNHNLQSTATTGRR